MLAEHCKSYTVHTYTLFYSVDSIPMGCDTIVVFLSGMPIYG